MTPVDAIERPTRRAASAFYNADAVTVADLVAACDAPLTPTPQAVEVVHGIPVYDMSALVDALNGPVDSAALRALQSEWAAVLQDGAGVVVLRAAVPDLDAVDAATAAFERILEREAEAKTERADHFSSGNDRIWNSLQKLALADPDTFVRYHGSVAIDAVCTAWLGPFYQMTAQVNLVHPGGAAQKAHRDYHLGFQGPLAAAAYPCAVHQFSQQLTLQGAVAHCDMPIESGPTLLLPGSQRFGAGYLVWQREDMRACFESRYVQLPLEKGDALFFNPALFHAAGANRSSHIERFGNLLQVSSAFGRAMEVVDRERMCRALYPALQARVEDGAISPALRAAIACCAEGYAFPTNLDRDPPVDGPVPASQRDVLERALRRGVSAGDFARDLAHHSARRLA
ncbi:MAG: phytanoyl-CoA dioxygenase family protein [Pseudomonadota bacterium]